MDLGLLLLALSTIVNTSAFSTCKPTTLYASHERSSRSIHGAAYDCHTIDIRPYKGAVTVGLYLELSWSSSHFDVKGNMPFCTEDYTLFFIRNRFIRNLHVEGRNI